MRLASGPGRLVAVASPSCSGPSSPWARPADPSPGQIQKQDRPQQLADRRPQGARARADERHLQPDRAASTRCSRDITRLSGAPAAAADEPRGQARGARRRAAQAAHERARLTRLRARLLVVRRALAARLVELYKADAPDVVTVVLESDGFEDLLTRTEFMSRISHQDARIMDIVVDRQGRRDRDREAAGQAREARGEGRRRDRVPARPGLLDPRRPRRPPRPHPDRPLDQVRAAAQLARPPPRARGRRRRAAARSRRRSRPSWPATRARCRRPDQARLRAA